MQIGVKGELILRRVCSLRARRKAAADKQMPGTSVFMVDMRDDPVPAHLQKGDLQRLGQADAPVQIMKNRPLRLNSGVNTGNRASYTCLSWVVIC